MNISRMTFVRPVVIAAVAVGLVGCSVLAPAERAEDTAARTVAEAPAPNGDVDQAVDTADDDEDVSSSSPLPDPTSDPVREDGEYLEDARTVHGGAAAGGEAGRELARDGAPAPDAPPGSTDTHEDWAKAVPSRDWESGATARPPSPTSLVDYLPATSALRADGAQLGPPYKDWVASPEPGGAVATAVMLLEGSTILVNDGSLEFFSPMAATSCAYCLSKLQAAYDIHDRGAKQEQPWLVDIDPQARVHELSGSDHLLLEIDGEENTLAYQIKNQTFLTDFPGHKVFHVEMLFDQGQWWVIGVSSTEV